MTITAAILGFLSTHFWALWWLVIIVYVLRLAGITSAANQMRGRK